VPQHLNSILPKSLLWKRKPYLPGFYGPKNRYPIPFHVDPEIEAANKKEKRLARSRKHQSKSWDKEKQDQIRAERKRKRSEDGATESLNLIR
jgi:hypothetical protein